MSHRGQEATADHLGAAPHAPGSGAGVVLGAATLALVAFAIVAFRSDLLPLPALALGALVWAGIALGVVVGQRDHPHRRFGAANAVTTCRAVITVAIAAFAVGHVPGDAGLWAVTAATVIALVLDGVDGPLARRSGLDSAFGARYDMEIDALLALVLAAAIWRTGELGAWILALGTMRYLFIAAAWLVPALGAPLFPSLRRKVVCVVQIAALCTIVAPIVHPPLAIAIGVAATLALGYSFARDILWLLRNAERHG